MQLGTFTANIVVDGKALEEYDVTVESPTQATCWVASEEGKSFGVQWKCHEELRVTASRGSVYVDGIGCGNCLGLPGTLGMRDTTKIISAYVNATTTRNLMFARIQLSDDDSLLNKEIHKNLGEISLVVDRGEIIKELRPANDLDCVVRNNEKLHERSKKATVHCVGFGPEKARELLPYAWRLIPNSQPRITFVFKYRPLSVLQANGIAPRPTSSDNIAGPESNSAEYDIRTSDGYVSEDIKPAQLNDRIQNLENELKRLRELQGSNSEDRKPKRIKAEEPQERRRPLFAPGEVIDLT